MGKIFSSLHVATKRKRLLPLFFFATEDNFTTYVEDDQRSLNGTNFIPTQCSTKKVITHQISNGRPELSNLTMPSQSSFAAQDALSPMLSTSTSCDDGRRQQQRPHTELSSCRESYGLFKRCSMAGKTEGYSCSDVVATYMRCAFDDCQ